MKHLHVVIDDIAVNNLKAIASATKTSQDNIINSILETIDVTECIKELNKK